jgi:NADPH2:quinone reductase
MKAIRIQQYGPAEVLKYEEVPMPEPGPGQARVKLEAIGVNFIDIYQRSGLYQNPLPFTLGMEGAGTVDALGPNVTDVREGERVAYAMELGSYAEYALVPAWKLAPLPRNLDARSAAAIMLQGMTAHYLTHSTFPLKPGCLVLVHAAAGGVGLLLIQIAKRLGATVFGTVSTPEKARIAREAGADEVILYMQSDFVTEIKRLTGGKGIHVVYDSVGKSTFEKSLDCLRPRGYLVLFGQSSGPVAPMNLGLLAAKGSLFVTRPTLLHYSATREELLWRAGDLFNWVQAGELKLRVDKVYPLAEATQAHRPLEERQTIGKLLLTP